MTRILVLGAGFGGITAAIELRRRLGERVDVTVVERKERFLMGLSKLWALDGRRPISKGERDVAALASHGVQVRRGTVQRIDLVGRTVHVSGEPLPYDQLVIALGADLAPDAVPGFETAHNLYDPAAIPRLAEAMRSFDAGRVLVAIAAMPFKCPPAPYEAAMLLSSLFRRRGVRDRVEIELTTPEPRPLPAAPASCGSDLQLYLRAKGVTYSPGLKPVRVDPDARVVHYDGGATRSYDALVGVPVHRAPAVVREAGLTDASGWIPVDPHTLRTSHADVHAVGDVTVVRTPSGKPLPKAGILAEGEAKVVAANIAAEVLGEPATARYDGRGACFIELGDEAATAVEGDFYALPEPAMTLRMPGPDALADKMRFEAERLKAWFDREG